MAEGPKVRSWTPLGGMIALAAMIFGTGFGMAKLAGAVPMHGAPWPTAGLAVAGLLLLGLRAWPGVLLGFVGLAFATFQSATATPSLAAGELIEAIGAAFLVKRLAGGATISDTTPKILRAVCLAGILAPLTGAAIGAGALSIGQPAGWSAFGPLWMDWWLGHMSGILVVTPVILAWAAKHSSPGRVLEAGAMTVSLAAAALAAWAPWPPGFIVPPLARCALVPLLFWAALRFRVRGLRTGLLLVSMVGTAWILRGDDPHHSFLVLDVLLGTLAVSGTWLSSVPAVDHRASENIALLQAVIEGTTDAVYVKDSRGRYLMINRAGLRLLGKKAEEVVGQEDSRLYSAETSSEIQKSDWNIIVTGEPRTTEEVRSIGGVSRVYSTTRAPYRDAKGAVIGVIGISRDITERKEAETLVRRQTAALTRALNLLAGDLALEPLVNHVVGAVVEELQASSASLFLRGEGDRPEARATDETGRMERKAKEDGSPVSKAAPIDERDKAMRWVYANRTSLVVEKVSESPLVGDDLRRWASVHGLQTLLIVPLLWAHEVVGVITVFNRERRVYKPEEQEMAQALAHQATLALELTRMAGERQEAALLDERNRMAREIHDTLAQGFTGILFQLEAAQEVLGDDPREAGQHIDRAIAQARESLSEARRSVRELRPAEKIDLSRGLRELVDKNRGAAETRVELSIEGASHPLPPNVEGNLLKIAQEALMNALKHAQARAVKIELVFGERETRLSIRDDGRGFSPSASGPHRGFGLTLMRERAQGFQGEFDVFSEPGRGTRVAVTVPTDSKGA